MRRLLSLPLIAALVGVGFLSAADAPQPDHASVIEREAGSITAAKAWLADQESRAVSAVKPLSSSLPAVAASAVPARPGSASPGGPALAGDEDGEDDGEEPEPLVTLNGETDGETKIAAGGFAVPVAAPEDAKLHWNNDVPEGAGEPLRLRDDAGHLVLVYFNPPQGRYVFRVLAQVPADGLDPIGQASYVVTVGPPLPPPVPPTPPDPPVPPAPPVPLTGTAKVAYEAAMQVQSPNRAQEAATISGVYRGVASQGAAVATMTPAEMEAKLTADMKAALTPEQRAAWVPFGAATAPIVRAARTRQAAIDELNAIAEGVEAVR